MFADKSIVKPVPDIEWIVPKMFGDATVGFFIAKITLDEAGSTVKTSTWSSPLPISTTPELRSLSPTIK